MHDYSSTELTEDGLDQLLTLCTLNVSFCSKNVYESVIVSTLDIAGSSLNSGSM